MDNKENEKDKLKKIMKMLTDLNDNKKTNANDMINHMLNFNSEGGKGLSDLMIELNNMGFIEGSDGTWSNGEVEISFYDMDDSNPSDYENEYHDFIGGLSSKPKLNKEQQLNIELENAISEEDYEKAILIRDELKKIKDGGIGDTKGL